MLEITFPPRLLNMFVAEAPPVTIAGEAPAPVLLIVEFWAVTIAVVPATIAFPPAVVLVKIPLVIWHVEFA